ncbi:papain-like cysteine peptidase [Micromonospora sp. CPCC 205371]|nr:papain-like cysteine peptidase [Micromonospora sp. CPCC 205371]
MFERYIGLGFDCEVTVQLRRLTGLQRAHVFDWYISEHEALAHVLRTDFADFFQRGNLVVTEDRRYVRDEPSGLRVRHIFRSDPDGLMRPELVAQDYPELRARADHLLERWRSTTRSERAVLYVRRDPYDAFTAEQLVELRDVLRDRNPGHRFALLWARDAALPDVAPLEGEVAELADGLYMAGLPVPQPRTVHWRGDDAAWDRLFPKLSGLRPLRTAVAR